MDKNTIIGLVLIGAILLSTPWLMKQFGGIQPETPPQEVSQPIAGDPAELQPDPAESHQQETLPAQTARLAPAEAREAIAGADTVQIETDLYIASLTNVGGGTIISWQLKEHLIGDKSENRYVDLVPENSRGNLGILFEGSTLDLGTIPFTLERDQKYTDDGVTHRKLTFSYPFADGGSLVKEFVFKDGSYLAEMTVLFENMDPREYSLYWPGGIAPTEKEVSGGDRYLEAFAMQAGEIVKTKEKPTGYTEGFTDWSAVRNKYFMAAIIPVSGKGAGAALEGEKIKRIDDQGKQYNWKTMRMQLAMQGRKQADSFLLYLGPLDYDILKSMNIGLEKVMDFGWTIIRPISIAFFYVLQFLYGIVGNYGWAIIIFSIMIKIVLYPLTRKSYQSMQAMQELQPKMEALKTKFKDDPQRMNQETMKLYKKHGVNPMGGCLPMLLQMPVLFALFNLFRTTIMLRQAEFLGGLIPDLSAPDGIIGGTIHVLPVLMGLTMIIQQRLTMRDPKQKAMAYMMPIMFSFIFYKMASGLNLYYLMFNLLTIAQEVLIKKKKTAEPV